MGFGSLAAILLISPYMNKVWLPLILFTLELFLFSLIRRNREAQLPVCYLIPFICTRILFWSALVMVAINLLHINGFIYNFLDKATSNPDIPYISILIVSPIAFAISLWVYIRGTKLSYCTDCTFRYGSASERGFLGNVFSQEGRYQVRMMMLLSLLMTVASWVYYFMFYININLNLSDRFFFVLMPVTLFVLSVLYLGLRYFSMWTYYCQDMDGGPLRSGSSTSVRFLFICGDDVFLNMPDPSVDDVRAGEDKYDTPAKVKIKYRKYVPQHEADELLKHVSGLPDVNDVEIRLVYINSNFDADYNIYHYACLIEDKSVIEQSNMTGEWMSLDEINELSVKRKVAPIICAEFNRIKTILLAWKMYDRTGRRLYNIKNYKPSFRLKDFREWTVDFNDSEWLFVSVNNEDKPFYRLKRFWRKHVNGIGD